MIENFACVVIRKPVDEVFGYITTIENIPSWVTGARTRQLSDGSPGEGTIFQHNGLVLKMTHYEPNKGYQEESLVIPFPISLLVKSTHGYLSFEAVSEGTRFTIRHQFELRSYLRLCERFLTQRSQRESQRALRRLQQVLHNQNHLHGSA
jgi:hypothetical protein